jgi:acyl carrier protein
MSDKVETELRTLLDDLGLAQVGAGKDVVFADLDLDSLTLMDLCVALENHYDFAIEPADVVKQATLSNLARFITTRRPERA